MAVKLHAQSFTVGKGARLCHHSCILINASNGLEHHRYVNFISSFEGAQEAPLM